MDWISTEEAAERLGVTATRIRQLIKQKRVKFKPMGRFYVVDAASLKAIKPLKRGPKPKK